MGKNIWRAHKDTDKLILVGKLMKKSKNNHTQLHNAIDDNKQKNECTLTHENKQSV